MSSAASSASAFTRTGPGLRHRIESIPVRQLGDVALASLFVAVAGALRWINVAGAPVRSSEEGVLVQRAWILETSGPFEHLTDWYDHPPLGWLVLSLWSSATSAFERAPTAIAAGRSLGVAAAIATAGLVWILARQLDLHRWATALAVVLLGASPLAVEVQRVVSLEALAVPWLVAAFALAAHPRRTMIAFALSAVCLAIAVLTYETSLLFAPLLVWQLHQTTPPSIRQYGYFVGASLFGALCLGYVVHAGVDGSLTAGADHPGFAEGVRAQLFDRPDTGSVFTDGSLARDSVARWFTLDPVGLGLMLICAAGVLAARPRLRPFAACALLPVGLAVVPGFASPTGIVLALPFGALVVAAAVQELWTRQRRAGRDRRLLGLAVAANAILVIVALWVVPQGRLLTEDRDAPARDAEAWIEDNLALRVRLLVDDALWTDLAITHRRDSLASYTSLDRDPALLGAITDPDAEGNWYTYDVVVATEALRRWPERYPAATVALENSIPVATFGSGDDRIELRRIVAEDTAEMAAATVHDPASATAAGIALSRNPQITYSQPARANLVSGEVDLRLMTTLVAVAGLGPVEVGRFPADPAELNVDAPRRSVVLRAESDAAAAAIEDLLQAQEPPYRPDRIEPGPERQLTVIYTPAALL